MLDEFKRDIAEIRRRARTNIELGVITEQYEADPEHIIKMLNEALATELICVLRYRRHYYMARGANSEPVAQELLKHSNEEQTHADKIAVRIAQLGGYPDLNPDTLSSRSHSQYIEANSLQSMLLENLVAERIAIDSYRTMIQYVGDTDPTTRRLLEDVLAKEEEHANELLNLL